MVKRKNSKKSKPQKLKKRKNESATDYRIRAAKQNPEYIETWIDRYYDN